MSLFKTMVFILCLSLSCLAVTVTNLTVTPRWPWNGKVDISFSIEGDETNPDGTPYNLHYQGYDQDTGKTMTMTSLSGDGVPSFSLPAGGPYKVVWDAKADYPKLNSSAFKVSITVSRFSYLVVNLETGVFRGQNGGPDLNDDTCRTTELWLRWIPAGTFTMGSPENELGRSDDETQHEVTLTSGYYIGVFEVTQKQWELIGEMNRSRYKGDTRPVESVFYNDIRGGFLRKLNAKTGLPFDLPTEAQWEYACRAGTTTALNSGTNLTDQYECPNMGEVGRYSYNRDGKGGYSEHTKVGSYLPNAWGLYDMHGNVYEWCLDWYGGYPTEPVSNPTGAASGQYRVVRGGCWKSEERTQYIGYVIHMGYVVSCAATCRSASRYYREPWYDGSYEPFRDVYYWNQSYDNTINLYGFRVVCCPPAQ